MAMSSLLLLPDNVESIREEDNGLTVITKGFRTKRFNTDKIIYFDEKVPNKFDVYDFFDTRSMKRHTTSEILDNDDFVRQINFYPSPRSSVAVTKDLVTSSKMTHEQLLDPSYGNGIAKIKALRMLKAEGITGPLSVKTETKTYYKRPKIEFFKRMVSEITKPLYCFDEVYKLEQLEGEAWKTIERLRVR